MASLCTPSYSLPRWLCSITDMPEPAKSSSSARARSRAGSGRAAGPALKLMARVMALPFDGEPCPRQLPPVRGSRGAWQGSVIACAPSELMARRAPERAFFSLLVLASVLPACHRKIEPKECEAMLDRYIDMVMVADPALRSLPPGQALSVREMKKAVKKAE